MQFNRKEKQEWVSQKVPPLAGATYHSMGVTTITQDILERELQNLRTERFAELLRPALDQAFQADLSLEESYEILTDQKKIANIISVAAIVSVTTDLVAYKDLIHRAFDSGFSKLWDQKVGVISNVTPKVQIQESFKFNPQLPRALVIVLVQFTRVEAMRMWAEQARLRHEFVIPDIDPSNRSINPLHRFAGVTTKEAHIDRLNDLIEDANHSKLAHHAELLEYWKIFFTTTSAPGKGQYRINAESDREAQA